MLPFSVVNDLIPRGIAAATVLLLLAIGCSSEKAPPSADQAANASKEDQPAPAIDDASKTRPSSESGNFDAILKKYVNGEFFEYAKLQGNPEDLRKFEAFLDWQAKADLKPMTREEQIAFYINAYNACCIKGILDHYPVKSPKDIPGFFDQLQFVVAGETLTVNQIEYDRLIAKYKDMRAHFAVNCTDRSCLPLKSGAYTGKSLDAELDGDAVRFTKSGKHFRFDHEKKIVYVSKLFDWYGKKFLNDEKRPVAEGKPELFLLPYLDDVSRKLLESGKYRVEFIEWDWTLNERLKTKESP